MQRVVAQASVITDQDEEEVEEDLSRLEAKKVVVADQSMIQPAERPRDLADSIRTQKSLRDRAHALDRSRRRNPRRSGLVYRRGLAPDKRS